MSRYYVVACIKVLYMSLFCGIALPNGYLSSPQAFISHNAYLCVEISAYNFRGNGNRTHVSLSKLTHINNNVFH